MSLQTKKHDAKILDYLNRVESTEDLTYALNDSMSLASYAKIDAKANADFAEKLLIARKKSKGKLVSLDQLKPFESPALKLLMDNVNQSRLSMENFVRLYSKSIRNGNKNRGNSSCRMGHSEKLPTKEENKKSCGCGGRSEETLVIPSQKALKNLTDCTGDAIPTDFFQPNNSTAVKSVRVNLVIIQKLDGTGNFDEYDPEHNEMFTLAENTCNAIYRDVAATTVGNNCNTLSDSRVQFVFNRRYIRHETHWNWDINWTWTTDSDGITAHGCPHFANWVWEDLYQSLKAEEPCDEEGITILLVNSGVNMDETKQHSHYFAQPASSAAWTLPEQPSISLGDDHSGTVGGCATRPVANPHNPARKHAILCQNSYNEYIFRSRFVEINGTHPYVWTVGNQLGELLAHELGHAVLDMLHIITGCGENLMLEENWGRYLTVGQLEQLHRTLSTTDLRRCVIESAPDYVISASQTWDINLKVFGNVRILNGATLTITCELEMPKNGKIIVERGAKLEVLGGQITSRCNPWYGIIVYGNATEDHPSANTVLDGSYPSAANHHGVVLLDGAILENAQNAVTLAKPESWGYDLAYSGGILLAQSSTFRNVKRGVEFIHYKRDNISHITNCTFETDPTLPLYFSFEPNVFISMWEVKGITIEGNIFINRDATGVYNLTNRGAGINSINASYRISRYTAIGTPGFLAMNSFSNLTYGVEGQATYGAYQGIVLQDAMFRNVGRSVSMIGVAGVSITNVHYQIGSEFSHNSDDYAYGILLEQCKHVRIWNCNFRPAPNTVGGQYGIIFKNCRITPTLVYGCTFDEITSGVRSIGDNSRLVIKCNDFNTVEGDIYVWRDAANQGQGVIGPVQSLYPTMSPANNLFTANCNNIAHHIHYDPFNSHSFFYILPNSSNPRYEPTCFVNSAPSIHQFPVPVSCPTLFVVEQGGGKSLDSNLVEELLKTVDKEEQNILKEQITTVKWPSTKEIIATERVKTLTRMVQKGGKEGAEARLKLIYVLLNKGKKPIGHLKQLSSAKEKTVQEHVAYLQIAVKAKGKNGIPRLSPQQQTALNVLITANGAASIYAKALLNLVEWINAKH